MPYPMSPKGYKYRLKVSSKVVSIKCHIKCPATEGQVPPQLSIKCCLKCPKNVKFFCLNLLLPSLTLTCLSLMTQESCASDDAASGIVTSLWECSELVGGYLGSTLGGVAASHWGFPAATTCVFFLQSAVLVIVVSTDLAVYHCRKDWNK